MTFKVHLKSNSAQIYIMRLQDQLQNSWENKIGTSKRGPDLACLVITLERNQNYTVLKFVLSFYEFRVHLKLYTIEPSHHIDRVRLSFLYFSYLIYVVNRLRLIVKWEDLRLLIVLEIQTSSVV